MIGGVLLFMAMELAIVAGFVSQIVYATQAIAEREYGWAAWFLSMSMVCLLIAVSGVVLVIQHG